ncbi:hypothetical protein D9M69_733540 [compost metagenome]
MQQFLILVAVTLRVRIALNHQRANGAFLRAERHAKPIQGVMGDADARALWQVCPRLRGQQEGLATADDLRAECAGVQFYRVGRRLALIDMVRKAQLIILFIV